MSNSELANINGGCIYYTYKIVYKLLKNLKYITKYLLLAR